MLQRSVGFRLAADRFVAPVPCLLLLLREAGTKEASRRRSCTSLQRSSGALELSLVNQGLFWFLPSQAPTYRFNGGGGLLTVFRCTHCPMSST